MRGTLARNLADVRGRIEGAKERSARAADDVKLVVVTKTVEADLVAELAMLGVTEIGENRVQDAYTKREHLAGTSFCWRMIGHLQTNKVRRAVQVFDAIDSVDSVRLARTIAEEAGRIAVTMPILLEVNVSGQQRKYGLRPEETADVAAEIASLEHVLVEGLMTMAPWTDDVGVLRGVFKGLRELAGEIEAQGIPGVSMEELSMGMSNDFEIAVEEGATMVRVGSAIFAGLA